VQKVQSLLVGLVDDPHSGVTGRIDVGFVSKINEKCFQPVIRYEFTEKINDFPFEIGKFWVAQNIFLPIVMKTNEIICVEVVLEQIL
jgi:hypothetical protein